MNKEEATKIIEKYDGWNFNQKSFQHAFGGGRNKVDDIYDERRELILKAYQILNKHK